MEAAKRKVMEAQFFDIRDRGMPAGNSTKAVRFSGDKGQYVVESDV